MTKNGIISRNMLSSINIESEYIKKRLQVNLKQDSLKHQKQLLEQATTNSLESSIYNTCTGVIRKLPMIDFRPNCVECQFIPPKARRKAPYELKE